MGDDQLASMGAKSKVEMGVETLKVLACETLGVRPYVPKPLTSGAKAEGRFGKQDFVYGGARSGVPRLAGGAVNFLDAPDDRGLFGFRRQEHRGVIGRERSKCARSGGLVVFQKLLPLHSLFGCDEGLHAAFAGARSWPSIASKLSQLVPIR